MRLKIFILLFERLPLNATNKALALLILLYLIPPLPQLRKRINQHTPNNITKEHIHKNGINHVGYESTRLK
jgi:hypothetical protein